MSKVFRTDIWIAATVYIRAESAEEAAQILAGMDTGAEFQTGQEISPGLEISGHNFDSDDLPDISLSPAMTIYPLKFQGNPSSLSPVAPNDFEVAHDPDDADDDAPDTSDDDDFRAFCEGATTSQLEAIEEKERTAGRHTSAAIARAVKEGR